MKVKQVLKNTSKCKYKLSYKLSISQPNPYKQYSVICFRYTDLLPMDRTRLAFFLLVPVLR